MQHSSQCHVFTISMKYSATKSNTGCLNYLSACLCMLLGISFLKTCNYDLLGVKDLALTPISNATTLYVYGLLQGFSDYRWLHSVFWTTTGRAQTINHFLCQMRNGMLCLWAAQDSYCKLMKKHAMGSQIELKWWCLTQNKHLIYHFKSYL